MRVGIIGTGLIGGSLGLALKAYTKHEVYCWNRRDEVSKKALKRKAADKYFNSIEAITAASDIIIIATPLSSYSAICKKISPWLDGKKIVSDVGSVKFKPGQQVLKVLPSKYKSFFVPAHPIAGKEKGGIENADKKLFNGKKIIIGKTSSCKKGKVIASLWKEVGAMPEFLNSQKHDEIYAYVSHYVQFLSHILAKHFKKDMGEFSRLMNSPVDMWHEIFSYNSRNLRKVHEEFLVSYLRSLKDISSYKGKDEFEVAAKIIVDSYLKIVPLRYRQYAGSGFKSFTSVLTSGKSAGVIKPAKASKLLGNIYNELKKAKF